MRTLLLSTAIAAVTSFGVAAHASAIQTSAQGEARPTAQAGAQASLEAFLASDFTGMAVHNVDADSAAALRNRNADGAADQARAGGTRADAGARNGDNRDQIGRVNDIVMTKDGEVRGVLVDVGGFLGIGAHTVMVGFDDLQFVADSDQPDGLDDFVIIISKTQDELEATPEWNDEHLGGRSDARRDAGQGDAQIGTDAERQTGDARTPPEGASPAARTPAQSQRTFAPTTTGSGLTNGNNVSPEARTRDSTQRTEREARDVESAAPSNPTREEYESVSARNARLNAEAEAAEARDAEAEGRETQTSPNAAARSAQEQRGDDGGRQVFSDDFQALGGAEELTADRLRGADVYDSTGNRIGSVNDVVIGGDDNVESVLVNVGGFLGIGARTVSLPVDDADIRWNQRNDDVRVQVAMTRSQLEELPEHEN